MSREHQFSIVPNHIAIIMDGNGRWATRRGYPRVFGHVRGAKRVKEVVREAAALGVKALTLYAFSTENWSRPEAEIKVLWSIFNKYLLQEKLELSKQNIRLRVIGDLDKLPSSTRAIVDQVTRFLEQTTSVGGLLLTIAVSYGGRREIVRAAQNYASQCVKKGQTLTEFSTELTEDEFSKYLWTQGAPEMSNVDLLIRTGGEFRISNFLLWQLAYAELVFTEVCWPDFLTHNFHQALFDYAQRERRFGTLGLSKEIIQHETSLFKQSI